MQRLFVAVPLPEAVREAVLYRSVPRQGPPRYEPILRLPLARG